MVDSTDNTENRIGLMHGRWVVLFKVSLVLMPAFLAWMGWVTANIYYQKSWMSLGPRFTPSHAEALETRIVANNDRKLELLARTITEKLDQINVTLAALPKEIPPRWWENYVREQLNDHETRIKKLEQKP